MKATDLQIGDWAQFQGRYIRVDAVYRTMIIPNPDDDSHSCIGEEYLQLIPLTPEILEKNGFKDVSVIVVGTRKLRWTSEDTRTEITIWLDDTLPMEIVKNIYYEDEVSYTLPFPGTVHELQHALKLCGIDKEIVL